MTLYDHTNHRRTLADQTVKSYSPIGEYRRQTVVKKRPLVIHHSCISCRFEHKHTHTFISFRRPTERANLDRHHVLAAPRSCVQNRAHPSPKRSSPGDGGGTCSCVRAPPVCGKPLCDGPRRSRPADGPLCPFEVPSRPPSPRPDVVAGGFHCPGGDEAAPHTFGLQRNLTVCFREEKGKITYQARRMVTKELGFLFSSRKAGSRASVS